MKQRQKNKITRLFRKWWVPFVFIIIPPLCIRLAGTYEWFVRMVVLSIVFPLGVLTIVWYALSPKMKMVKEGGKLTRPEYSKMGSYVAFGFRVFFCLTGLTLLFWGVVPIGIDVGLLMFNREPVVIHGNIKYNNSAFGLWFMYQGVGVETYTGNTKHYHLLYSTKQRLPVDNSYELLVLPRSKIVLKAKEITRARE